MNKYVKISLWVGGFLLLATTAAIAVPKIINARKARKDEEIDETTTGGIGNGFIPPNASNQSNVNPIGNAADVKKFQDWMDLKHPNWLNTGKSLNKGAGYGNFGSQTSAAWQRYSTEYRAAGNAPSATVKTFKAYSANMGNPIYRQPSDIIPYRLAGKGELLGNLTGEIKPSYSGTKYAEIVQADKKNVYALYNTISLKP
jgi:hypothetical protein